MPMIRTDIGSILPLYYGPYTHLISQSASLLGSLFFLKWLSVSALLPVDLFVCAFVFLSICLYVSGHPSSQVSTTYWLLSGTVWH